jgi:hypothetical protein
MDKHSKVINDALIIEREKERYLEQIDMIPKEFEPGTEGDLQWSYPRTKESKEYLKDLIERNPTHTAKRPSRSKKPPIPPKGPWRAPSL